MTTSVPVLALKEDICAFRAAPPWATFLRGLCRRPYRGRRQSSDSERLRHEVTYNRTYELKMSDQALSALRREVRAARLGLRRDTRLGLEVPQRVVQLSGIDLPPVVRRYRLARAARPEAFSKAWDSGSDRWPAEPTQALDSGQAASATENPVDMELDLADGRKSNAASDVRPEESPDHHVQPASGTPAFDLATPASVETSEAEHSGNVTLYLPKDLSQWLTDHHDASRVSYPEFVLNTISWATAGDRLSEIFPPEGSAIPVNDVFGRPPVRSKPVSGSNGTETRRIRFRKDHMKVIIGLARTWTADNRNALFVGVLEAYRDRDIGRPAY
ncbi:MAG: hypothetical protein JWM13_692 [Arthrobacter sp.]|nr:hypothetical protein [Arthrobacter sp.]